MTVLRAQGWDLEAAVSAGVVGHQQEFIHKKNQELGCPERSPGGI